MSAYGDDKGSSCRAHLNSAIASLSSLCLAEVITVEEVRCRVVRTNSIARLNSLSASLKFQEYISIFPSEACASASSCQSVGRDLRLPFLLVTSRFERCWCKVQGTIESTGRRKPSVIRGLLYRPLKILDSFLHSLSSFVLFRKCRPLKYNS